MMRATAILDASGQPFKVSGKNGHARRELVEAMRLRTTRHREIHGSYDAARDSDDFKNYWANTDKLDADSANSKSVRSKLVSRSRYETANNGFADGIVQTYATDLVGIGPKLRMQSPSEEFNKTVEHEWLKWTKAVQFRRKLWCMAHAKPQDGEAIGLMRDNPGVRHRVTLDVILIETEQCQTPMLPYGEVGYIDGIKFDDFGNPIHYDVLPQHPGGQWGWMGSFWNKPEPVPAKFVLHWFALRRPGQHRGVPEFRSTLNVGAAARRWREATIAAAESAADFSVLLQSNLPPNEDEDSPLVGSTAEIQKRMMVTLPDGYAASQLRAEHPNGSYETFHKSLINEQARPKSMPYNKAACDSSSYNYSSGRLDHQTYYAALDVDREDCNDQVLDPLFGRWWSMAVLAFGWAVDPDEMPSHTWDWPEHPASDPTSEASADQTRLQNGSVSLSRIYSKRGEDFEDEIAKMSQDYGVTVQVLKARLFETNLPPQTQPLAPGFGNPFRRDRSSADKTSDTAKTGQQITAFDPNQPRDDHGRFSETGGGGGSGSSGSSRRLAQKFSVGGQTYRFSRVRSPGDSAKPKTLREHIAQLKTHAVQQTKRHVRQVLRETVKEALQKTKEDFAREGDKAHSQNNERGFQAPGSEMTVRKAADIFRRHATHALKRLATEKLSELAKKHLFSSADDRDVLIALRDGTIVEATLEDMAVAALDLDLEYEEIDLEEVFDADE